jgi:hypothetical protein
MQQQLVNPLLTHPEGPLLLLQILALGLSLIGSQFDYGLNIVWMQAIEHLEEEVAFR